MAVKSWRDIARPIVAGVLRDTVGQTEKEIRAALFAAYPFGERRYHPYKIWLDEIRRQRKLKATKEELSQRWLEEHGQMKIGGERGD